MSIDLDTAARDTEPEPMPELAEPEPLPASVAHPDADVDMTDDRDATDDVSSDTEDEAAIPGTVDEQEPDPEDSVEFPDADLVDPEDHGTAAENAAPDLFNSLRAEAKSRSLRSLAQGAVVAVLAQVLLVLYPLAQHLQANTPFHVDWRAEGLIVAAAAANALIAYVQKAMGR